MSYFAIPLEAVPNQTLVIDLGGKTWTVTVETRLENLYLSLSNGTDGVVILNRICRDRDIIADNFFFYDQDGIENPSFDGLGRRYVLVWST